MVKCADCGFLSVVARSDGSYIGANRLYRLEGFQGGQVGKVYCEPHCSIYAQDIHLEPLAAEGAYVELTELGRLAELRNAKGEDVTDKAVLANISKPRVCTGFFPWHPGFTPKEHREMLDRQGERKWRIIERVIFVILAGLFTLLGAYIANL